jgi:multicomponent Na+:H+ antiporter subunit G
VQIAGIISTTIGTVFLFLGSLGVYRMPDVYNRLQAGTKCTTLGAFLTVIGVGLIHPDWFLKTLVIASFIIATNPISNHALGRAARKAGIALCDKSVVDRTEDFQQNKVEE